MDEILAELKEVQEALSCMYESIASINNRMDLISERVDFAMQAIYDLQRKKANREIRACR